MFGAPNSFEEPSTPILLEESSRTLDLLFRLCYPVRDPKISDVGYALQVLDAADKYMMEHAAERMREVLLGLADKEPLRLWAAFYIRRLPEEALVATQLFVTKHLDDYVYELESVDARAYWALIRIIETEKKVGRGEESFKEAFEQRSSPLVGRSPAPGEKISTVTHRLFHRFTKGNMADADVVIRTSDGESFFVDKAILCRWSPVLMKRLAGASSVACSQGLDRREDGEVSGIKVLAVEEDSWVMGRVLRYIYPGENPRLETIDMLGPTLIAAVKYQMQDVVENLARGLLTMTVHPLTLYAVARACRLRTIAMEAARRFLSLERTCVGHVPKGLNLISAGAFYRLRHYHRQCTFAATLVLVDLRWLCVTWDKEGKNEWTWFRCAFCRKRKKTVILQGGTERQPSLWWYKRILQPMAEALNKSPCEESVRRCDARGGSEEWVEDGMCHRCRTGLERTNTSKGRIVSKDLDRFKAMVASRVQRAVGEISVSFDALT
ncbi:hypothetical protein C8Q80DRAFT_806379 [Daedaleopsis nitida]|nr:hypothetical protein C8Q80DRAFT_806379 [Daedaleopsis nitida]